MATIRKHSKKRDAILNCMRGTTCHPTAEWVYQQLKPQFPDLSLGTIYRNIAAFKAEGMIDSVGVVNGLERYDANTAPHAHIICTGCGAVLDAETVALPEDLFARVQSDTGCELRGYQITFSGTCPHCLQQH